MSNQNKGIKEKLRSLSKHDYMVVVCAVLGIAVVSAAAVFVVRAFLTDYTNKRDNVFSSMTYTNIEIVENPPSGGYTVVLDFDGPDYNNSNYDGVITKEAQIKNMAGDDKKPVYLRAKVIMTIYDSQGYNITSLYSTGSTQVYIESLPYEDDTVNWTPGGDGYYYYNRILLPGDSTVPILRMQNASHEYDPTGSWNKVKIKNAADLPAGSVVHIDILADAVQAVSTDKINWTTEDYYDPSSLNEVNTAWGKKPSLPAKETGSFVVYDPSQLIFTPVPAGYDEVLANMLAGQVSVKCQW